MDESVSASVEDSGSMSVVASSLVDVVTGSAVSAVTSETGFASPVWDAISVWTDFGMRQAKSRTSPMITATGKVYCESAMANSTRAKMIMRLSLLRRDCMMRTDNRLLKRQNIRQDERRRPTVKWKQAK